jgi:hypothetical protein
MLFAMAACVPPPSVPYGSSPSPVRDAAVGCWRLESSPGVWGRPLASTLVRLDTATTYHGVMRMHLIPAPESRVDMNRWGTAEDGKGVVLSFSDGFGGVVVRATIRGDQLRGRGRTWADVPVLAIRGPVRGERVPCPSESAAG